MYISFSWTLEIKLSCFRIHLLSNLYILNTSVFMNLSYGKQIIESSVATHKKIKWVVCYNLSLIILLCTSHMFNIYNDKKCDYCSESRWVLVILSIFMPTKIMETSTDVGTTLLIHAYCLQKLQNVWLSILPLITSNREIDLPHPLIKGPFWFLELVLAMVTTYFPNNHHL